MGAGHESPGMEVGGRGSYCADAAPGETASGPRLLPSYGRVILRPFRPQHEGKYKGQVFDRVPQSA